MDPEPEVIREQIEETRSSLTEKLETLEGQVKETVESVKSSVEETVDAVKSTVTETVDTVKSTVQDTVETVRETFNLSRQVRRHPWGMLGGSLLSGMALGYYLAGRRQRRWADWEAEHYWQPEQPSYSHGIQAPTPAQGLRSEPAPPPEPSERSGSSGPGLLSRLLTPFESEIGKIKETAIGAALGVARDVLEKALPASLAASVEEIMNNITRNAGGKPVHGPVLAADGGASCSEPTRSAG